VSKQLPRYVGYPWWTFFRGRAETVFGPLGLILAMIGAVASAAFVFIAAFVPPRLDDLYEFSGTVTQQPQMRRGAKRPPWIELTVKERQELLAIQNPRFLDEDLVRDVLSLTAGTAITAWSEPNLKSDYLVIWQLRGTSRPLQFADSVRAHYADCLHYLKFSGLFVVFGLTFLLIEVIVWRRRQRAARLPNA
jgi:hypothetical protein